MKLGDRVRLRTFNGAAQPPPDVLPNENYWRLAGMLGTIRSTSAPAGIEVGRVLVEFDVEVPAMGLECHNETPNALWILRSDLEAAGPPRSAADFRDAPYYIPSDCLTCGTKLVLLDLLTDPMRGIDTIWYDEWECPRCKDGISMDVPADSAWSTHSGRRGARHAIGDQS